MSENATRVKEKQILIRAIHDSYFTKTVLSKNVSALINNPNLQLMANVLVRYYATNTEPLSLETFNLKLENYVNLTNRKREQSHQPIIDGELLNQYFVATKVLYNAQPDTSDEMLDSLTSYIRENLTNYAILEEATNKSSNLSERVEKRMTDINAINLRGEETKYIDILNDVDTKTELYKKFNTGRVPSGLKPFDVLTGGGLEKGQVGMIAGPQGGGKSAMLTNLSYYYAMVSKKNVLHISLEELDNDQNLRFDRIITDSGMKDVFDKEGNARQDYLNKMKTTYREMDKSQYGKLIFEKHMTHTLTVDDLDNRIKVIEREANVKFDVLILDYADLLKFKKGNFDAASVSNAGEDLFEELTRIAQEHEIVIMTGAQLNRGVADSDTLTMELVQGSYKKKNVIAFGATINATREEKQQGYVRLYLDKVRNDYGFEDRFLYMQYDRKTMKLHAESADQVEEHKALVSQGISPNRNANVKKEDKTDTMMDVINKAMEGK
jgi:archaellum biogenesis ATPase FlaH